MKRIVFVFLIVLLCTTGCTTRDRHLMALTHTMTASNARHNLEQIQKIDGYRTDREPTFFAAGLGGFTTSR